MDLMMSLMNCWCNCSCIVPVLTSHQLPDSHEQRNAAASRYGLYNIQQNWRAQFIILILLYNIIISVGYFYEIFVILSLYNICMHVTDNSGIAGDA